MTKRDANPMPDEPWLRAATDAEEAADLTARLVAIRSYPGEEGNVQREVAAWLAANGLTPERQETGEPDRPNVLARVANGPGPTLLLNGHTDTVIAVDGWSSDPWTPKREGDRLYGLGACDMKAGIAAAMLATRALAQRRDRWRGTVVFAAVVDEGAYSLGARALLAAGLAADACVVTESNWAEPCLGSVGKLLVRADVTGKAAHATWPAAGINAAVETARFAARLDELPLGDHPHLAASQSLLAFHSGGDRYVVTVPEHARLLINRHTVPGEDAEAVVAQYRALADGLGSPADFAFALNPPRYPPWEIAADHPFVARFAHAYAAEAGHPPAFGYRGYGDANLFAGEAGIPTVQFGPLGANFHAADEWVDVPSVAAATRVLLRLALSTLATP